MVDVFCRAVNYFALNIVLAEVGEYLQRGSEGITFARGEQTEWSTRLLLQFRQQTTEDALRTTSANVDEVKGVAAIVAVVVTFQLVFYLQAVEEFLRIIADGLLVVQLGG